MSSTPQELGEAASKISRDIWKKSASDGDGSNSSYSYNVNRSYSGDDEDDDDGCIRLKVAPSTIPNAGDGLFLSSAWTMEGTVMLEEEAIAIKRSDAKIILKDPMWKYANPVIQCNSNRYLDIRKLLLYKSNHCFSTSRCCNVYVKQCGSNVLQLIAMRDIDEDEELMWEYSPSWYPPEC